MKEIMSNGRRLTNQAQEGYSMGGSQFNWGGNTFMAEAKGEVNARMGPIGTARESQAFQNPLTHSHESIRNPQLKQYVSGFEQKMQQKPISAWSPEELRTAYFDTSRFTSRLGTSMEFGEREGLYADIQPLDNLITGELERRGVNLKELFLENQEQLKNEGLPKGGVGAPGPTDNEEPNKEPAFKDKVAAEILARFRMEHGETDPEKISQFERDLSTRIQKLMNEKNTIGAGKGALTPEGEPTADTAAAFKDIDDKISQIQEAQGSIFDMSPRMEKSRGRESNPAEMLVNRTDEFVDGILAKGLQRSDINDLSKLNDSEKATRKKLVEDINNFIKKQHPIDTYQFPSHILLAARNFTELREQLISTILFKSFEDPSETNHYEVGLYAASNLDVLLGFLSKDDNARYEQLFSLRTAANFFQEMNSTIIKGNFDDFSHSAANINYKHFENMRDIRGSGVAMRLFEQGYKDVLANNDRIQQDKIEDIKNFVERRFREINDAGLIKSEFSKFRDNSKMDEWEIRRAMAAGRTFFNITLRAAENIATGQIGEKGQRLTSPPQEDMVRILNWNQWFLTRFHVGEARHGLDFLKMSIDKFQEFSKYKGAKLGINKIKKFGGVDVEKMESGGQYKTSGVYSGWRIENIAFDEIFLKNLKDENGNPLSVKKFAEQKEEKIKKDITDKIIKRKEEYPDKDPAEYVTEGDQEAYKKILMPIVDNLDYGLSMLLKNSSFGSPYGNEKLGYKLRTAIWEKIARTNTPLMIDYLTKIEYEAGTSSMAEGMEKLREDMGSEWVDKNDIKSVKWETFKKKILIRFERTTREGAGEELPPLDKNYELDVEEKELEKRIRTQGEMLAPHLADIMFPYTPFMNDMPFEKFQYKYAGQTFYKRRTTGDLGGYNKGQQAFMKIMNNPGGIPAKEAIEAMGEIVEGIGGPEGVGTGMEANFPTFSALMDVVITEPGVRQGVVKMLLEAARKPTSTAQLWNGIKADSFTEPEAANMIDDTLRAGLLTPELARYLKKKKKLALSGILWALFRDVFPMIVASNLKEFVDASLVDLKAK